MLIYILDGIIAEDNKDQIYKVGVLGMLLMVTDNIVEGILGINLQTLVHVYLAIMILNMIRARVDI